jgi:AcrR family transcriptional regulator
MEHSNRNEQRREATRDRLIETAGRLFAQRGFHAVTVREIAREARVALGLLYNYYDSKEDLLMGVFQQAASQIRQTWGEGASNGLGVGELIHRTFRQVEAYYNFWRMIHALRLQMPEDHAITQEFFYLLEQMRERLSSALAQEGWQEPELRAWELLSLMDGMIGQYLLQPQVFPLRTLEERIIGVYASRV